MQINNEYDVAIVGGGLAGLAASIQLSKAGYSVILFEKEKYPFHKVCGEYVSMESWDFLESLGLPLTKMRLPFINTVFVTAPNGKSFSSRLPLGGFGISRYVLDHSLAQIAKESGVHLLEETKVDDIKLESDFIISLTSRLTDVKSVKAKVCCAAFGKRSNLDVKWKRKFLEDENSRLNNYVGIKYHVQVPWNENVICLHNFKNGYCGLSKIEDDKYCLCYMTKAENLKKANGVEQLEKAILSANPHLKKILLESKRLKEFPVVISQINFNKKKQVENGILMLGDAAGMIAPLCGNGMSIAFHTSKIAAEQIDEFLKSNISRRQMERNYEKLWRKNFRRRMRTGRMIQRFFGSNLLSNLFVGMFRAFPFLARPIIKMTHGKPY